MISISTSGNAIPGAECQEGGMACDKECGLVDVDADPDPAGGADESGCITVMEEMCMDVSKEQCGPVDEKVWLKAIRLNLLSTLCISSFRFASP